MKIHKTITEERIMCLIDEDDNMGLCIYCGSDADGVEPDARGYDCENCDKPGVFGAEELLFAL